jgi:hypothetical protein
MLPACAASGSVNAHRDLPNAPHWAKPVTVADPRQGEPAILVAGRERAGRAAANRVIEKFRSWYQEVQASYVGK